MDGKKHGLTCEDGVVGNQSGSAKVHSARLWVRDGRVPRMLEFFSSLSIDQGGRRRQRRVLAASPPRISNPWFDAAHAQIVQSRLGFEL
jgi:hypothetical protein